MKKLFLVSVLSALLFSVKGQVPLDSFYRKGATWCEYSWWGTGFFHIIYFNAVLYTGNDTTINGLNYHALWCDNGYGQHPKLIGGLRVDTSKVYFFKLDTLDGPAFAHCHKELLDWLPLYTDTLLYDFNLKVGDSLAWKTGPYKKVIEIDSIQATNGTFIKRFYFHKNTSDTEYWLEGPGSNLGLYAPGTMYPLRSISYHYSDMIVFNPNPGNPGNYAYICFPTAINHIENERKELALYPNPLSGDELQINVPANISLLTITDISGRIKHCEKKLSPGKKTLNILLAPGVYFVQFQFEDGTMVNRKLVKQ
jgi:hypothetical protein